MKILADESVERQIVERLRREGHDVLYVAEMEPGITDDVVLGRADEGQALLLTADKDFGELVFRQRLSSSGIVLLRLSGLNTEAKSQVVSDVLSEHASDLREAFCVISPGMVRIRFQQS